MVRVLTQTLKGEGLSPSQSYILFMSALVVYKKHYLSNLTCFKSGEKGHLAQVCPHTGSAAIAKRQQILIASIQQVNYTGQILFPATNPTLSQTITSETPNTADI